MIETLYPKAADAVISREMFLRFYREFAAAAGLEKSPDIYDLHAYVALACGSRPHAEAMNLEVSDGSFVAIPFMKALAGAIALRSIFLDSCPDREGADAFVEKHFFDIAKRGGLPYQRPDLIEVAPDSILLSIDSELRFGSVRKIDKTRARIRKMFSRYYSNPRIRSIASEIPVAGAVLEEFANAGRAKGPYGMFTYPKFVTRLRSVFGATPDESLFEVSNFGMYEMNLLGDISEDHVAVIGMYPWEADHIEKAMEMAKRGIPVCEPLGRLFLDELEFALFRWVPGTNLEQLRDVKAWAEYGKTLRMCHERGVMLNDAAGRNAITGERGITLIDFEHTVLTREVRRLTDNELEPSLSKIEFELKQRKGRLLDAFMRGYKQLY
jgi:hypothetical protein